MLSTTTQISFRNTLDSVLTWASLKPINKPHPEDGCNSTRRRRRSRDIFSVLVTPDRIPKFIIPPLDVEHHLYPRVEQEPGVGGEEIGAGGRRLMSPGSRGVTVGGSGDGGARRDPSRRRERLCGKPKSSLLSGELQGEPDHSDPTTRAALSLPHLQKITTPYGFLALGESPSIRRKESLFFERDSAELRALLGSRRKSPALARSRSSPLTLLQQRRQQQDKGGPINSSPAPVIKASRSASWDLLAHPSLRVPGSPSASPAPSPSHYRTSFLKDKSKFQVLIKKHFSNIKRMRSSSSSSIERFLVPVDRALSNPNP